jgi:uncharacterized membrane protein
MENKNLKQRALQALEGKWDLAVGVMAVDLLLSFGLQIIPGVGSLISLVISGPLSLGISIFTLSLAKRKEAFLAQLFEGFNNFGTAFSASILLSVFTLLWTLLLVVPGIIAALSYSQTFYIIAENPSMGGMEAINKSKELMNGHKTQLFLLIMSFWGWFFLCILTCGIGFLWLIPYFNVTLAEFYQGIKGEENSQGINIPAVLDSL